MCASQGPPQLRGQIYLSAAWERTQEEEEEEEEARLMAGGKRLIPVSLYPYSLVH